LIEYVAELLILERGLLAFPALARFFHAVTTEVRKFAKDDIL
jgi:hypothetical protein